MILIIAMLIVFVVKSLDFLYLFQTKEYRLDRILSFFKEKNIFNIVYLRKIRIPGISLRNILITQGIIFNILPLYIFLRNLNSIVLTIFFILMPVIALLTMFLGMLLSEIPVQIYRKILIIKATQKVRDSKAVFIGITGSFGKTSTKEFLFQILAQKYKVEKTEKNINSDIGIAISVLKNLKKDTEFFITEIGAYKKGEIKSACEIIKPKYGILTGIGNQHLSLFGSKKKLSEAKSELLQALAKEGKVYVNKDIERVEEICKKTKAKKFFFSSKQKADISLKSYKLENNLTKAEIIFNDVPWVIKTRLLGLHNLDNLLPCIALANDLGVEKDKIIKAVRTLRPVIGRLSQEKGPNSSTILNDSYNSNVEGFLAAIEVVNQLQYRKKIIISRGLIELAVEKKSSYQKIVYRLAQNNLTLLTTDELFKKFDSNNLVIVFRNEDRLVDYLMKMVNKDSLIVSEGRFEAKTINALITNN